MEPEPTLYIDVTVTLTAGGRPHEGAVVIVASLDHDTCWNCGSFATFQAEYVGEGRYRVYQGVSWLGCGHFRLQVASSSLLSDPRTIWWFEDFEGCGPHAFAMDFGAVPTLQAAKAETAGANPGG